MFPAPGKEGGIEQGGKDVRAEDGESEGEDGGWGDEKLHRGES